MTLANDLGKAPKEIRLGANWYVRMHIQEYFELKGQKVLCLYDGEYYLDEDDCDIVIYQLDGWKKPYFSVYMQLIKPNGENFELSIKNKGCSCYNGEIIAKILKILEAINF